MDQIKRVSYQEHVGNRLHKLEENKDYMLRALDELTIILCYQIEAQRRKKTISKFKDEYKGDRNTMKTLHEEIDKCDQIIYPHKSLADRLEMLEKKMEQLEKNKQQ